MKDEREFLYTGAMEENPIYVSIRAGNTISTAPYESAKIEIGLSCPSKGQDLEKVFETARDWLDIRLGKEISEIRQYVEERKNDKVDI